MNPKTVQRILELPEISEMLVYFEENLRELNNISDIDSVSNHEKEVALEVLARKRAYDKLKKILEPFISSQNNVIIRNINNEYTV